MDELLQAEINHTSDKSNSSLGLEKVGDVKIELSSSNNKASGYSGEAVDKLPLRSRARDKELSNLQQRPEGLFGSGRRVGSWDFSTITSSG